MSKSALGNKPQKFELPAYNLVVDIGCSKKHLDGFFKHNTIHLFYAIPFFPLTGWKDPETPWRRYNCVTLFLFGTNVHKGTPMANSFPTIGQGGLRILMLA